MIRTLILLLLSVLLISCQKPLSDKEVDAYKKKGALITGHTASTLSETLTGKMKSGGLVEAVEFCNTAALPLTRQISDEYKVRIKRTSLKTRNPLNSPSENEIEVLNEFQSESENGITPEPLLKIDENGIPNYYAPIFIEKKCLICHGKLDKELSRVADSIIKSHYPNDLATGFQDGDLRGMWSISFVNQIPDS